jgi:hypothetical protein
MALNMICRNSKTTPPMKNLEKNELLIAALQRCAAACHDLVNSSLDEIALEHTVTCVRLALDGAGICEQTGAFLARGSAYAGRLLEICLDICSVCAEEMARTEGTEACRQCAAACRDCADAISKLKNPASPLVAPAD